MIFIVLKVDGVLNFRSNMREKTDVNKFYNFVLVFVRHV